MGWSATVKNMKILLFLIFWVRVSCNSGWSQICDVAEENLEYQILLLSMDSAGTTHVPGLQAEKISVLLCNDQIDGIAI